MCTTTFVIKTVQDRETYKRRLSSELLGMPEMKRAFLMDGHALAWKYHKLSMHESGVIALESASRFLVTHQICSLVPDLYEAESGVGRVALLPARYDSVRYTVPAYSGWVNLDEYDHFFHAGTNVITVPPGYHVHVEMDGTAVLPAGAASFRILLNSQYARCPVLPMYDPTTVEVEELEDWTLTAIRTRHHVNILQNGTWKTLCPLFLKDKEE